MTVKTIYLDLNVRLDNVDNTDTMTIPDSKAVKQSLWRLLNTKEGEIPYYRSYGLDLEQFCQAHIFSVSFHCCNNLWFNF